MVTPAVSPCGWLPAVLANGGFTPFLDHWMSLRMANSLFMLRHAQRVASVMLVHPVRRSAPMARLRNDAMTRGRMREWPSR